MITASAPGKLVLMGEYAVVYGHAAVVAAVDVRAVCTRQRGPLDIVRDDGGLVDAVFAEAGDDVDGSIVVDTSAFRSGNEKYGLGSSAAACVALLRALLPHVQRDELHVRAQRAHRNFQQGRGSGVDVCASVFGGVSRYVRKNADEFAVAPVPLPVGMTVLPVWTGVGADTRVFLRAVEGVADRAAHVKAIDVATLRFLEARHPHEVLIAVEDARQALLRLGQVAGVDIVSDVHQRVARIARNVGGAAKPSGAGGGDVALVFVPDDAVAAARALLDERGFRVLSFAIGGGVDGATVVGDGA